MQIKKIALLGKDVSKSLSPPMHNEAFQHLGLPYEYEAFSVSLQKFLKCVKDLENKGYWGFNITIPYKEVAIQYPQKLSPCATKLNAINTIYFSPSGSFGENTDVAGVLQTVQGCGVSLSGKGAFIFGAGGASKASIEALTRLGVKKFVVGGRDSKKLQAFHPWFKTQYPADCFLQVLALDSHSPKIWKKEIFTSDVFVNAAPLEACQALPFFSEIKFKKDVMVIEWVYEPRETPWLKKGRDAKGTLLEGYKILLYQGVEAFTLWTGVKAPENVMEKALLKRLR